jgi:hypothetical protein
MIRVGTQIEALPGRLEAHGAQNGTATADCLQKLKADALLRADHARSHHGEITGYLATAEALTGFDASPASPASTGQGLQISHWRLKADKRHRVHTSET